VGGDRSGEIESSDASKLERLVSRMEIEECLLRYCRGIDRHDVELVRSAYHPDARDDHAARIGLGHDLADWANAMHDDVLGLSGHQHYITNVSIELDGDTAHVETYYFTANVRRDSDELTMGGGRYLDRFERRDGVWAIAARIVTTEWWDDPEMLRGIAKLGIAPVQGREDPSFRRPLVVDRADRVAMGPGS